MALHCHGCWLLRVSRAPGAAGALSGSLCAQSAPCASSWLLCSLLLELLLFSGNPTSTYRQWEPDPQQPVLGDQLCSGPLHFTYILDKDLDITRSHSLKKIFFFFFLATWCGTQDLGSPTRDKTRTPCSGSLES